MKILIADDETQRYETLVKELEEIGVQRVDINIVSCANDAKASLADNYYDLFLLDILLPLWSEETDFTSKYSLDLLFELTEGDILNKPGKIIGITGDKSVLNEAEPVFSNATWNIIEYSNTNNEWIGQVKNCVTYILANLEAPSSESLDYQVDLVVICALEKPELEEVLKLNWNWEPPRPLDDITFIREGYFFFGDKRVTVAATSAPRMGMVSTSLLSAKLISLLRPKLISMCGICAGVKNKVKMGEVLFADTAWDYQSGKRVIESDISTLTISPHQIHVDQLIRSHVQQLSSDKESLAKIYTDFGGDAIGVPTVHLGPIASGSAVLADGEIINEIKAQHRELIGVEMEIYGLYAAADEALQPKPKAFALKSVCDFANQDKADNVQRYAAYTSAKVLQLLMEKYADRLLN